MDVLGNNSDEELAIFRAFVKRTLKEHVDKIDEEQSSKISAFESDNFDGRSFYSSDVSLKYSHRLIHRVAEMKRRRPRPKKNNQLKPKKLIKFVKDTQIHNRILMGNFAGIQGQLTYGLTEAVRNQMKKDLDGKEI